MANPSHDLLPCPFCGGAARIESNRDWHRIYAAHDDECVFDADDHALMYPAQPGYLIQIAEDWNRRATPPSPSTAPEVPPFPESFGLADVPHAMNTPDDWDADYRATWQKLQVAEINLSQMRAYARKLRAALDSRPAEVDDEGLPPLRTPEFCAGDLESGEPVYTAEQYRQGQRDAVAADRARRGDINPEDAFVLYSAADVIDECGKVLVALKVRGIADRVIMPEITKAPR